VSDQDAVEPAKADPGAEDLALRALAAVDQKPLVTIAHHLGREAAMDGRGGGRSAEEDDFEQGRDLSRLQPAAGSGGSLYLRRHSALRGPLGRGEGGRSGDSGCGRQD